MNNAEPSPSQKDEPGEVGLVVPQDYTLPDPFEFDNGTVLRDINVRYETYGKLNGAKDNAILICHALSGDHHCAGIHSLEDRRPGWWDNMIGPGKPIDTNRFFVICSNCIGGCRGTTGPSSINPQTERPYHLDFPRVTIGDMVRVQERLITGLGIEKLYCAIGGSMGGMQVLEWMVRYPDRVRSAIPLATTARQNAQAIAFNEVGRTAIMQDPNWREGTYPPEGGPRVGLSVARMMAHITYLSDRAMQEKFGRTPHRGEGQMAASLGEIEFAVESYLRYQGNSFVNRFDANTYLYFTKALDRFDLYASADSLEPAFRDVTARVLVIGFTSDWLFPPEQNRALVHALLRLGKAASYAEVDMEFGHDSFLVHAPELYEHIRAFLDPLRDGSPKA